ncbi:MAG: CheY-P-specific phosphatase CheC [Firmicutes bacterium HGW-Firmicutes-12]|jgi:chemotaxis protein CheC|nr:MAG: CheY-P-specific phosphatase CheC [Firmicutes bacterium HGW-Firmicutes-12]
MKDYSELNTLQVDALKEISNIGAGNAATSLSVMLNRKIDMSVPRAQIAPFAEIVEVVGGADKEVVGGYLHVGGEMPMGLLFLLQKEQVMFFMDILFSKEGDTQEWNDMYESAFKEIVNILAGSYLNAIAMFTKAVLNPSVPSMAIDMAGAILGEVLQQIGEVSDYALIIENIFIEEEREITGHFFFLPEPETLEVLMNSLGVL